MKKLLFLLLTMLSVFVFAQENETDENGEKHGKWVARYPSGKLYYEVNFSHGTPVGTEKRYDAKGKLKISLNHFGDGKQAAVYMYNPDGSINAMGKYYDKQRDSIWRYFYKDTLVMKEMGYKKGVKHGKWITYYDNGQIFEYKEYNNGAEFGEFKQYFKNGQLKLEVKVVDGKWSGTMKNYYPNGNPANIGLYQEGLKEGKWVFYDERGNIEKTIHFNKSEVYCSTEDQITYYDRPSTVGEPQMSYDDYGMMNNEGPEEIVMVKKTVMHWDSLCTAHFTAYYPDEKVQRTGFYVDNVKDSVWTYYNTSGKADSSFYYDKGVKNGESFIYHANGEISVKQFFKDGKLHGVKELYSATGKLIRRDEYVNGTVKQLSE